METIKYSLKNTGIDVAISEFKGDKLKIKVLEGLLKATEQRLMYYINAETVCINPHLPPWKLHIICLLL